MSVSRNDPCPCGSGRKYKHCHGRTGLKESAPDDVAWRRLRRALDGYPAMMLRFIEAVYGPGAIHEAWGEFIFWEGDEAEFDPNTPHLELFMPWFFHRWAPDPDITDIEDASLHHRSPTSVLIERRGRRLDPVLRRYLEGCLASALSFHEVLRCDPGHGFRTRDVLAGEEREVLERSASRTLETGHIFYGQLVTSDGVTLVEALSPYAIPPAEKLELIDLREDMVGDPNAGSPELLREWDLELRDAYLGIVERIMNPPLPRLQNTDGEDLAFHRLSFEVTSAQRAFDALKHLSFGETEKELLESAELDEAGPVRSVSFAWSEAGNPMHPSWDSTVLGHIEIDGDRLVANVNSAERAERFRKIVDESLGGDARITGTEVESLEDAMARRASREQTSEAASAEDPMEHPEVIERIREMTAKHYEGWIHEAIPALGGLTPLEAVEDEHGRERVEVLIGEIERHGLRMRPPLDEAVTRTLRERLGLSEHVGPRRHRIE